MRLNFLVHLAQVIYEIDNYIREISKKKLVHYLNSIIEISNVSNCVFRIWFTICEIITINKV